MDSRRRIRAADLVDLAAAAEAVVDLAGSVAAVREVAGRVAVGSGAPGVLARQAVEAPGRFTC